MHENERVFATTFFKENACPNASILARDGAPLKSILAAALTETGSTHTLVELVRRSGIKAWVAHLISSVDLPKAERLMLIDTLSQADKRPRFFALMIVAILVTVAAFSVALVVPFFNVTKLWVFKNDVSVLTGLSDLWHEKQRFLFGVILAFTVVFPVLKLIAVVVALASYHSPRLHETSYLQWISSLGKFSMLDVFLVAIVVYLSTANSVASVHIGYGIYLFAASVIVTQLTTLWLELAIEKAWRASRSRAFWIERVLMESDKIDQDDRQHLRSALTGRST